MDKADNNVPQKTTQIVVRKKVVYSASGVKILQRTFNSLLVAKPDVDSHFMSKETDAVHL